MHAGSIPNVPVCSALALLSSSGEGLNGKRELKAQCGGKPLFIQVLIVNRIANAGR